MASQEKTSISNLWHAGRPFLLIAALMLLSVYTNDAVIDYRMQEFNRSMEALSQKYNQSHSLNMLARFELIRQRKDIPEEDEAALEMRLRSLTAIPLVDTTAVVRRSLRDQIIGGVIAAVRFVLGKPAVTSEVPTRTRKDLEVGYFYERARKYDKAVLAYTGVLEAGKLGKNMVATALLHRGFCLSLLSEYPRAEADFRKVIEMVGEEGDGRTAARFLETLAGLQLQLQAAKAKKQGPLAYGRQLLLLANYTGALEELGKALAQSRLSPEERLEGLYLFGRAQEEVGLDSEAVLTYRSILRESPQSGFSRKANRRLYMLGKVYGNDKNLEKEALKQIEQYQDMKFIDHLKTYTQARLPDNRQARRKDDLKGIAAIESLVKEEGLEQVSEAALAAENAANQKRVEAERLEAQKLSANLKNEARERRPKARRLQPDPMRREAILQVFSANKGELQFLFQKWLRKGAVFEGDLTVRLMITPSGDVSEAKVVTGKSTISHGGFIADVLQNTRRWKFREDPGAEGDLQVTFPLQFVNKE